eukprot:scaffold103776_cov27-Tisochrysis_lutea.AAC.7
MAVVEFLYVEDASWPAFASQCCCRDRYPGVPALANRTELWTCEDKEVSLHMSLQEQCPQRKSGSCVHWIPSLLGALCTHLARGL